MKKICLAIVLSVVSIFPISAQSTNKLANNVASENVKIKFAATETEIETPQAISKPSETNFAVEQKPRAVENDGNAGLSVESAVKDNSLGTLSTGNAAVDDYIELFSELYDVDSRLIYAQMNQESGFKAKATSGKGASGFMQLMPDTARRFGVKNIYNPKQNIKAGVKYMRWLLDKFGGDKRLALAGYNAGEGSVIKYGNKIPPYRETQNYVAKIMNHYESISSQSATLAENDGELNK
ncbi:MAG TPA: lytic transglycosylase domain-containing protein [Pyrinomonadaceae bacterium]|jgi:soluble lytic murein transglycosylase-like protein